MTRSPSWFSWVILSLLGISLFTIFSCSSNGLSTTASSEGGEGKAHLRIGIIPTRGILPLWVANQNQYFDDENISVELVSFQSASEKDAAFQAGEVDGMISDLVATTMMKSSGVPLQVVSLVCGGRSGEGRVAVVAAPNSEIRSCNDLKGKHVAVSPNTIIEYATDELLTEEGLKPGEVSKVPVAKIHMRMSMMLEGKVAAATLPEPLITFAQRRGARVITDDRSKSHCFLVVAMRDNVMKIKEPAVRRFLVAYNRAVSDINRSPGAYRQDLLESAKVSQEVKDVIRVTKFSEWRMPTEDQVNRIVDWLDGKRLLRQSVTYQELVDKQMFDEVRNREQYM